ncbi:hypothetical protein ACI8B_300055 [Acinetobacter proteolyticus]|jgi:hypothetical protein|uniref:Uncharacterized protein n=1 Tax=Acinetobacter proteolyticus TaxID=1776741 RepID=A0A653K7R4_9GAMM|nr:hypothetical protein ACI8B_300055 [Acinetobacter proteolyticus]
MAARPKAMLEVGYKTAKQRFAHRRKTEGYA